MASGTQALRGADCAGTFALRELCRVHRHRGSYMSRPRASARPRDARRAGQCLSHIEQELRIGTHARAMPIDVELDQHGHARIQPSVLPPQVV